MLTGDQREIKSYSYISSKDNQLIKLVVKLAKDSTLRHEQNKAIIYGQHLVEEAIANNIIDCIFISENKLDSYTDILDKLNLSQVYIIDDTLFNRFNIADSSIDIVAIINFTCNKITDNIYNEDCIILENVQDPGNLGAILRAAKASNIQNIILSNTCVDIYNLKVLRASQGMQFGLNIITNADLFDFTNKYNGQLLATSPRSELTIYQIDFTKNIAMFFGNEGSGLSEQLLNKIVNVKIPMLGDSESLNLAMSVTVCVFEMVRQRCI